MNNVNSKVTNRTRVLTSTNTKVKLESVHTKPQEQSSGDKIAATVLPDSGQRRISELGESNIVTELNLSREVDRDWPLEVQCMTTQREREEACEARIIRRNMPRPGSRAYKQQLSSRKLALDETRRPSLKLTLPDVRYYKLSKGRLKKMKLRRGKLNKDFWPYLGHKFKLGHDPWAGFGLPPPKEAEIRTVHRLLMEHNRSFEFSAFVALPAHAVTQAVTVDNLIQTIFSQTTGNELAIDGHSRLCNAFPYTVQGKKYAGTIPNWHVVRTTSTDILEGMLQPMGLQLARAKAVKSLLDVVYNKNLERRFQGIQQYIHEFNEPNAKDFVPGLLSIDYLTEDDPSTETLLGRLLELPKFGPKSAMCVAAFSYRQPLFVVDVHVARFCKWLNWVPAHATEIEAACYLHSLVPDNIKFDLHNQIWSHCAVENGRERHGRGVVCYTCGSSPPAKGRKIRPCPLDRFLPPLDQRWKRKYQPIEEGTNTFITSGSTDVEVRTDVANKQEVSAEQLDTIRDGKAVRDKGSMMGGSEPRIRTANIIRNTARSEKSSAKAKKWPRTVPYESMSQTEATQAGHLLWEFRPMDNSFGEEWGTFDKLPRFRWEKPDIMDAEVAVTTEYADGVLSGRIGHKWMKRRGVSA